MSTILSLSLFLAVLQPGWGQCNGTPLVLQLELFTKVYIESPGFQVGKYPQNLSCAWRLDRSRNTSEIIFTFHHKGMVNTPDTISLYEGVDNTGNVLFETIVNVSPDNTQRAVVDHTSLFLQFTTDDEPSNDGKGFEMYILESEDYSGTDCLTTKHIQPLSTTQYITSPNFPQEYPLSLSCVWNITTADEVLVSVIYMDVEKDTQSCFDSVTIGDSVPLCAYWEFNMNLTFFFNDSFLIIFSSDIQVKQHGFVLSYVQHKNNTTEDQTSIKPEVETTTNIELSTTHKSTSNTEITSEEITTSQYSTSTDQMSTSQAETVSSSHLSTELSTVSSIVSTASTLVTTTHQQTSTDQMSTSQAETLSSSHLSTEPSTVSTIVSNAPTLVTTTHQQTSRDQTSTSEADTLSSSHLSTELSTVSSIVSTALALVTTTHQQTSTDQTSTSEAETLSSSHLSTEPSNVSTIASTAPTLVTTTHQQTSRDQTSTSEAETLSSSHLSIEPSTVSTIASNAPTLVTTTHQQTSRDQTSTSEAETLSSSYLSTEPSNVSTIASTASTLVTTTHQRTSTDQQTTTYPASYSQTDTPTDITTTGVVSSSETISVSITSTIHSTVAMETTRYTSSAETHSTGASSSSEASTKDQTTDTIETTETIIVDPTTTIQQEEETISPEAFAGIITGAIIGVASIGVLIGIVSFLILKSSTNGKSQKYANDSREIIDTHTTEISVPPRWIQMIDTMKKNNYNPTFLESH